jgi:large subunit ribosomal protein L25
MKSLSIKGTKRVGFSNLELKKLRTDGNVPCVLYGNKQENVHFYAPALSFRDLVYSPNVYTVNIDVEGKHYNAIMKEIQFHPVKDCINHIDFLMIFDDKPVTIDVPVKVTGAADGVKQGGKLIQKLRKLKVSALPGKLPDAIELNVTPLNIGDSIKVGNVNMDGITFLDAPNNIIVGVRLTRNVVEETPAAAPKAAAAVPAAAAPAAAADKKPADKKK